MNFVLFYGPFKNYNYRSWQAGDNERFDSCFLMVHKHGC